MNPNVFAVGSISISYGMLHLAFFESNVHKFAIYIYGMKTPTNYLSILNQIPVPAVGLPPRKRFDIGRHMAWHCMAFLSFIAMVGG